MPMTALPLISGFRRPNTRIEPPGTFSSTRVVDLPRRADVIRDPAGEECLRQANELATLLVLAGRHRRKARIGKDQAGNLAHRKISRRQEAISIEDPPRPVRGAVKCTVACKVDYVEVLIHDQEGEFEWVAGLVLSRSRASC